MRRYPSQEFAFGICHCFDHVLSIGGVKEKLPTFGVGLEFNVVGIAADGRQKIVFVNTEHSPQICKCKGRIIFELEGVVQQMRGGDVASLIGNLSLQSQWQNASDAVSQRSLLIERRVR